MDAVSAAAPPKLDVARVLLAAAVAPVFHKRTLVWFALPVLAAELASNVIEEPAADLLAVVSMVAVLVLHVACHRTLVLGPHSTAGHSLRWWVRRVGRLFGWGLGVGVVCAFVAIPAFAYLVTVGFGATDPPVTDLSALSPRTVVVALALSLPALYVFSRLALVLPAVATLDAPGDLGKAWQQSAGNGIRLTLVVGLFPTLFDALFAYVPRAESLLVETAATLALTYVLVVSIAALSMTYRELAQLSRPQ